MFSVLSTSRATASKAALLSNRSSNRICRIYEHKVKCLTRSIRSVNHAVKYVSHVFIQLDGDVSSDSDSDDLDDSESEKEQTKEDSGEEPLGSEDDLEDEPDASVFDTGQSHIKVLMKFALWLDIESVSL